MNIDRLFAIKWFHTVVLIVLVAIIMYGSGIVPGRDLVAGGAPILAWVLGLLYERSIILNAGLVDRDDLKRLERSKNTIWGE